MLKYLLLIVKTVLSSLRRPRHLALENLALRQQLAILRQSVKRPWLPSWDRYFWVIFSKYVADWRAMLHVIRPDTVVRWHRQGFRYFWTWKSRRHRAGRPRVYLEIRTLIRQMQSENVGWGAPRIHGELLKLGFTVSQATVSNYLKRSSKPPSQTWRTFLINHAHCLSAIDFFLVPTATFRLLYVLIVLNHERRTIVHFNVTYHPSAEWTARQLVEAFPFDSAPRYLIRDRDGIYNEKVRRRIKTLGIEEVITAPQSPWQNPYVERVIGSIRRDCLNHVIVINQRHLKRILRDYLDYYHHSRTHLSLGKDSPEPRSIESQKSGKIVTFPKVGGLHHHYCQKAA